ncbi:MAG: hypothetical protein ACD_72C00025G0002 [uncultured bacterium]|nr:MAG: hypothetical protein ACD_72C00025G0002 [uncultured bacterium]
MTMTPSPETENPESQMFGLLERLKRANNHLEDIVQRRVTSVKRDNPLVGAQPDAELSDAANASLEVIDTTIDAIYDLLPGIEKMSENQRVAWTGSLRDLKFDYLGDGQFKIDGLNLLDRENLDTARTDDQVQIAINSEVELPVEPQEHLEALVGIKTKIYRA